MNRGSATLTAPQTRSLLPRIRFQFLLLTGVVVLVGYIDLLRLGEQARPAAYVASVAGYGAWAGALYATKGRLRILDLLGPLLVFSIGFSAGGYDWAFGALYAGVFLHLLFATRARALAVLVLYALAYEMAVVATVGGAEVFPGIISHVVGLAIVGYLIHMIATVVGQHDCARQRERALSDAGVRLSAATDAEEVSTLALEGLLAVLAPSHPDHRVTLWRQEGPELERFGLLGRALKPERFRLDQLPPELVAGYETGSVLQLDPRRMAALQASMGVPSEFEHGVSLPLHSGDGLVGLVFVSTREPVEPDLVSLLHLFTHQVALADVLAARNTLLTGVVNNSADGIVLIGRDDTIVFASPSVARFIGRDASTLTGRPLGELLLREGPSGPVAVCDLNDAVMAGHGLYAAAVDGRLREVEIAVGAIGGHEAVLNVRDVTERRRLEEEVAYRAFHDPVTGLANRALFTDRLEHALMRLEREHTRLALALIDLDDFKSVNDAFGHSVGDELLREVSQRLEQQLRRGDTAARFGGDEFAILMEDVDADEALQVIGRVAAALQQTVVLHGHQVDPRGSIGVRVVDQIEKVDALIRDADVAMYAAKAAGKNRVVTFEDGMREDALARIALRGALTDALEHDRLHVNYQPIVDVTTGIVHGFEALARWTDPVLGSVPPDVFIPLAETSGMIVPLGRTVLRMACEQLADWRSAGTVGPHVHVAVNLSMHQLFAAGLIDDVMDALRDHGLPASALVLEVTESTLMAEADRAAETLGRLRALGIRVAIDDFGTGYSSFSHLQHLPVDVIKIDRTFISGIGDGGPRQAALVEAIVNLAATLSIDTIAEGVETQDQSELLRRWRCNLGQGWLWAKAMPPEDVAHWMAINDGAPLEPVSSI